MKIGVLSNLRAGKRDSKVESVLGFLRQHPEILRIETESDADVSDALAHFQREGVEVLVLNGGDGTVQLGLTHLLGGGCSGWDPWVAPIRGGRTNMTAADLGAQRHPVKGLQALVAARNAASLAQREVRRAVMRIELGAGRPPLHGMFLGAGMLHRAVDFTHKSFPEGRAQGTFGAGVVTAMLVARAARGNVAGVLTPDKMRISCNDEGEQTGEVVLAMASTLHRLFLGLRPFWGEGPGPVRVTTIAPGAKRFGLAAPGVLFGHPPRWTRPENGYVSRNVREAAIQLDAGLVLDGELYAPEPDRVVKVSAVEGVRFLRA
ncbi:MAG: diacylglycerol kinase family protein [Myxococcota bacterium]|nr:diacylglycerol kinase family protein [Myxococcota bacterium]